MELLFEVGADGFSIRDAKKGRLPMGRLGNRKRFGLFAEFLKRQKRLLLNTWHFSEPLGTSRCAFFEAIFKTHGIENIRFGQVKQFCHDRRAWV